MTNQPDYRSAKRAKKKKNTGLFAFRAPALAPTQQGRRDLQVPKWLRARWWTFHRVTTHNTRRLKGGNYAGQDTARE